MFETAMFLEMMEKLVKKCHENSREKGFWTGAENDNVPTKVCLMHSELSELLEAYREGNPLCPKTYKSPVNGELIPIAVISGGEARTITCIEEEAADLFIRLCDFCGRYEIELGRVTLAKMEYNKQRSFMHGGKKV